MSDHCRMTLNNYLQGRYGSTKHLSYEAIQIGTQHQGYWVVVAYFNGIEYGRANGVTKGAAAEASAHQALVAMRGWCH